MELCQLLTTPQPADWETVIGSPPAHHAALRVVLCRLRTSRNLWNITERQEMVTEDCYSYTVGADVLVVLTNRGSNLGNATKTCSLQLPASSQLMRKGLTAMQDVLDFNQVRP